MITTPWATAISVGARPPCLGSRFIKGGVQWKQGVVVYIIVYAVLLCSTTPIHCTPLRLHPPLMNTHRSRLRGRPSSEWGRREPGQDHSLTPVRPGISLENEGFPFGIMDFPLESGISLENEGFPRRPRGSGGLTVVVIIVSYYRTNHSSKQSSNHITNHSSNHITKHNSNHSTNHSSNHITVVVIIVLLCPVARPHSPWCPPNTITTITIMTITIIMMIITK